MCVDWKYMQCFPLLRADFSVIFRTTGVTRALTLWVLFMVIVAAVIVIILRTDKEYFSGVWFLLPAGQNIGRPEFRSVRARNPQFWGSIRRSGGTKRGFSAVRCQSRSARSARPNQAAGWQRLYPVLDNHPPAAPAGSHHKAAQARSNPAAHSCHPAAHFPVEPPAHHSARATE